MAFDLFLYLTVFILGLIVGSFLNCFIYRLETGGSFLRGRSFCPHCKHTLDWRDLIPILSFLILRGRCRYCQKRISVQYPLVELFTGTIFFLIFSLMVGEFSAFQFHRLIYYFIIAIFIILIFIYDLKNFIIPDKVVYPAIVVALIFNLQFLFSNQFSVFQSSVLSGLGGAAFFLIIVLISQGRWMGLGDVKLAFLMGLFLGWPSILVALFSAFFIGALIGVILMILKKKTLKSEVPFGPFLVIGTFLALFWGGEIIHWYLGFFLIQ